MNNMVRLDLEQLSLLSKENETPFQRFPTTKNQTTTNRNKQGLIDAGKGNHIKFSKLHENPVIQSIITNGQVSSFLKVKKNQTKESKKAFQLSPVKSLGTIDSNLISQMPSALTSKRMSLVNSESKNQWEMELSKPMGENDNILKSEKHISYGKLD